MQDPWADSYPMTEISSFAASKTAQYANRPSSEEDGLLARMKKMMKIKKMTDYFAASPSGKMILFTKKKMTIEMPPLSTVVPML